MPRPIDVVADAVGNEYGLGQREANDAGMGKVEPCVMGRDDGIMFRYPLELAGIFHSAGHHGVRVNGARRCFCSWLESDLARNLPPESAILAEKLTSCSGGGTTPCSNGVKAAASGTEPLTTNW